MYSRIIMHISCSGAFRFSFCAGAFLGGVAGLVLGFMDSGIIGLFGGMFLGLVFALVSGAFGAGYALVFNALAPLTGGLEVTMEELPAEGSPLSKPGRCVTKENISGIE